MTRFDKFCNLILEKYNLGSTAYGNADIDKTTAMEIKKGDLQPNWQFLGNKNNKLTAGYSVAHNTIPHGTIVKITDKNGNPVGSQFGNTEGIFKVEDIGGPNVHDNVDFYSGSNKEMYNYFANLGDVTVTPINLSPENEKQLMAKMEKQQGTYSSQMASADQEGGGKEESPYTSLFSNITAPLAAGGFTKETGVKALGDILKTVTGGIQQMTGNKAPIFAKNDTDAFLGKGRRKETPEQEKETKEFLGEV